MEFVKVIKDGHYNIFNSIFNENNISENMKKDGYLKITTVELYRIYKLFTGKREPLMSFNKFSSEFDKIYGKHLVKKVRERTTINGFRRSMTYKIIQLER
jgi:hypothetical protein